MGKIKNIKILFFALMIFVCFSTCKKEGIIYSNGKASAMVNGMLWESEVRVATLYDKFDMTLEKYKNIDGNLLPWETMGIDYFNKNLQYQNIIASDSIKSFAPWDAVNAYGSFGTAQDDGDVECDFFVVIESDSTNNWVRIDRESNNYNEVWGSFSMHLYRTNTCNVSIYPDTLLITNGQFHFEL